MSSAKNKHGSRLRVSKLKIPELEIKDSSVVKPNKVSSLEFNSDKEENWKQQILPPWGSFSDEEMKDGKCLDNDSTISTKTIDEIEDETEDELEDEIYYLDEKDGEILSERILKLSRSNKVKSALSLYNSMKLSDLLPSLHACNSLITCLLRDGRLDDALKVFEFMKSNEIMSRHSNSLILKAVADVWGCDAALRLFQELEKDEKLKKYMDTIIYNTMISIFAKVNNWIMVERMWRSCQGNGHVGSEITYRLLVCTFVRGGQNELALDAYHEMIQNGLRPCGEVMEAIIGACTREGMPGMALDIFENMLSSNLKPRLVACNALINSLGKAGKVDIAFKVFGVVKSLDHVPDSYTWNALLIGLNRANRHGDALRLFEKIREENSSVLNVHIYNTCLVSCQRLGLWERAVQLLWQMEESGFRIPAASYNLVIGACLVARKPMAAVEVYNHSVEQKVSPDLFTLSSLLKSCIWGSLWCKVEEIVNSTPKPNGSLYNIAIQGMCLRDKTDMARKLYARMREIGLKPDGKTRALMLENFSRG